MLATEDGKVLVASVASVIVILAEQLGHSALILLQSALHLVVQLLLELQRVAHRLVDVAVLLAQILRGLQHACEYQHC